MRNGFIGGSGRRRSLAILLLFGLVTYADALGVSPAGGSTISWHTRSGVVPTIPAGSRWWAQGGTPAPLVLTRPNVDAEGVPFIVVNGRRVYKPVALANRGLALMNGYRLTSDRAYITAACTVVRRLVAGATVVGTRIWYPYRMEFSLGPGMALHSPWYSAMAQGEILSLLVALVETTGDAALRKYADWTFNSLVPRTVSGVPAAGIWDTYVDANGYLWAEEYPLARPTHVLNGLVFATFGALDYAMLTRGSLAGAVYQGLQVTVRHYALQYRRAGARSVYDLRTFYQSTKYHAVHTWQMRLLARYTGDAWFSSFATTLDADYTVAPWLPVPTSTADWPAAPTPSPAPGQESEPCPPEALD